MRTLAPSVLSLTFALGLLAGCSDYEPFHTVPYLEQQFADRVPAELAGEIEIPFDLSDEVRQAMLGRLGSPTVRDELRTQAILDFIFSGLELEYSLTPTRNANDTFAEREANCLSFVNLFVGIGRTQRLNPFYVEVEDYQRWTFSDGVVVSRGHIVAGLIVEGQLSTYDFLPYAPKAYRDFQPIGDLTAMAHFYNNLGAEALMAGELEVAEKNLRIAIALAPDFEKAVNNLGVIYLRRGRIDEARALYERGLEANPLSVPQLTNLARVYQVQGETAKAGALLAELDEVNLTNPFYFVYRGEAALAEGDLGTALSYMRDALRADSEVPEVHVGLTKVYMALGQIDKARHHVQRALRLDATHEEGRRYAALLRDAQGTSP